MGIVLRFHARNPSTGIFRPKRTGSTCKSRLAKASDRITQFPGGMRRRSFQLDTADMPTPASAATAAVPPRASTTASTELSIPTDISRGVNMSSVHGIELSFGCGHPDNLAMSTAAKTLARRLKITREALGLSAADICRRIDCKANRWSQYESGDRQITLPISIRLCEEYGLTL